MVVWVVERKLIVKRGRISSLRERTKLGFEREEQAKKVRFKNYNIYIYIYIYIY